MAKDVAFIIPTKDRPEKLKTLIDSIAEQNEVWLGELLLWMAERALEMR